MASVLLIDDDDRLRAVLESVLTEYGHTVTPLADGRKALESVKAGSFDLILTDLMMPERDGFETIAELRKAGIRLPIIAMSGNGDSDLSLLMAKKFGAVDTLAKPFKIEKLLSVMNRLLTAEPTQKS